MSTRTRASALRPENAIARCWSSSTSFRIVRLSWHTGQATQTMATIAILPAQRCQRAPSAGAPTLQRHYPSRPTVKKNTPTARPTARADPCPASTTSHDYNICCTLLSTQMARPKRPRRISSHGSDTRLHTCSLAIATFSTANTTQSLPTSPTAAAPCNVLTTGITMKTS